MGVGVSGWSLARAVSTHGQLGVVSGTALDTILVRRLGVGDPGSHMRRAMDAFPVPQIPQRVLAQYYRPDRAAPLPAPPPGRAVESDTAAAGTDADTRSTDATARPRCRFSPLPLPRVHLTPERQWLLVLANFVEVHLAKEGHAGMVGINYLHKIQFPLLPSLYGAMLAGVDAVLIGAGIPSDIPAALECLSRGEAASIAINVEGAPDWKCTQSFDPTALWATVSGQPPGRLDRPRFLPIVSSETLARALQKKAPGGIDGFIVEAPTAGGHNAPPRGVQQLSVRGEPVYGPRDVASPEKMAALGVPFWLAGGFASSEKFHAALAAGAHGVQIGTAFAFCDESGLDPALRRRFLGELLRGAVSVFTDPRASPTGYPFKVVALPGTMSDPRAYADRTRLCDLGYLRVAYRRADGTLGYRCPGEDVADYLRKGGTIEEAEGRKCLCNSLMANIGLGQRRDDGYEEPPLLTAGDDLACIAPLITPERRSYRARDVIDSILQPA